MLLKMKILQPTLQVFHYTAAVACQHFINELPLVQCLSTLLSLSCAFKCFNPSTMIGMYKMLTDSVKSCITDSWFEKLSIEFNANIRTRILSVLLWHWFFFFFFWHRQFLSHTPHIKLVI